MIDVKEFLRTHSVDELNRTAEEYFVRIKNRTYLLAKPFAAPDDCAKLLTEFCAALSGLDLCAGMKVLDFGPGSCWTSHFLTQMGCKVYACDISPTALEIGKERYRVQPVFGNQPEPELLVYDGYRLPLPDGSVDRLLCMHALHHIPNVRDIIYEMFRVLGDYGIAAFAEPGPDHSRGPVSQAELESGVLENDIVVEDIWRWASSAGFKRLELTAFPIDRVTFSLETYQRFLAGDAEMDANVLNPIRRHAAATRTFFLCKEVVPVLRSTSGKGLAAKLEVAIKSSKVRHGDSIDAEVKVVNTGEATWLPSGEKPGAVNLGFHLRNLGTGESILDYGRALLPGRNSQIGPGEGATVRALIPCPPPGSYELIFDLVSEHVTWFANHSGTQPVKFQIIVI